MKQITLTQGRFALVDDADFDWLNQWKWHFTDKGYAERMSYAGGVRKYIAMHRLINNTPTGAHTDHKDGDTLNNQRNNLREATRSQNGMNKRAKRGSLSIFKGVSWSKQKGKWVARIFVNRKSLHLGFFDIERSAAIAYNMAAIEHFGEFSRVNPI